MAAEATNKDLLIRFIEEVWNAGVVDAADKYIAPTYTIHHDPGDPWDGMTADSTLKCTALLGSEQYFARRSES